MFRSTPDELGDLHEAESTAEASYSASVWSTMMDSPQVLRESGFSDAVEGIFTALDTMGGRLSELRRDLNALSDRDAR